jgi:hypothetical protein
MEFNFNFKSALVKSGKKVVDESKPVLTLLSTFNNFKLNRKAMQMLDVAPGGAVVLLDGGAQAPDLEHRFFIGKSFKAPDKKGKMTEYGSKITENQSFTYSVVYGAILAQDMDVISITPESLIERGLLYDKSEGSKSTQYISAKVGTADIIPFADGEPQEVADNVFIPLFLLTNFDFEDYTPKGVTASVGDNDVE